MILKDNLTYEEYKEIAINTPKRDIETIFQLRYGFIYSKDIEEGSLYPSFNYTLCVLGYFKTKEDAELRMREYLEKFKESWKCILFFKIYEQPMGMAMDIGSPNYPLSVRQYLYDENGIEIEHSCCSSLDNDFHTEYGSFLGRPKENVRFYGGEVVEIIGYNKIQLAMVINCPVDIELGYSLYQKGNRKSGDYSDEQAAVSDGFTKEDAAHSHIELCNIMKPHFEIPEEIKRKLLEVYEEVKW